MVRVDNLGADALRFRDMRSGAQVLDTLEEYFRSFAATVVFVSGIPLPGRAVEPLIVRAHTQDPKGERHPEDVVQPDDPVFAYALGLSRAEILAAPPDAFREQSGLYRAVAAKGASAILCVPVSSFQPFQGIVVAAAEDPDLDRPSLLALQYLSEEAFQQLFAINAISPDRPGALSGRERIVVAMSAEGRTASDIADALTISQRTVHAHLQNASDKLRARNKTQTVVLALRYGQIAL